MQKDNANDCPYNQRLFSNNLRGWLHGSRYRWVKRVTKNMNTSSVLELGCFDGKVLDYLPKVDEYLGLDANWEGGLELAKRKWKGFPGYKFRQCLSPAQIEIEDKSYNISICMETLEHIPEDLIDGYLSILSDATKEYLIVTIPNETGVVFFFKYISKLLMGHGSVYSFSEFVNQTIGNTNKVGRDEHKGFSHTLMLKRIEKRFDICSVSGAPFSVFPKLSFNVCIVAKPRVGRKIGS